MEIRETNASTGTTLHELPIYGSGQLGQYTYHTEGTQATRTPIAQGDKVQGARQYALSNQSCATPVGNVLATISDLKRWDANKTAYTAQTISASDYYPFGLAMQGRTATAEEYRYGFQNQEQDDDLGYTVYKYRMHIPALGRFISLDPLFAKYPYNSPYAFSENRVMDRNELEGLETGPTHAETYLLARASKMSMVKAESVLWGTNEGAQKVKTYGICLVAYVGLEVGVTKGRMTKYLLGPEVLTSMTTNAAIQLGTHYVRADLESELEPGTKEHAKEVLQTTFSRVDLLGIAASAANPAGKFMSLKNFVPLIIDAGVDLNYEDGFTMVGIGTEGSKSRKSWWHGGLDLGFGLLGSH